MHSGGVDITHEARPLDLLGPGDTFGHAAMLSGLPPGFEARAAQDTLCYRIPVAVARPILERARNREPAGAVREPSYRAVAELIRAPTVRCDPSATIGETARRMTEAGAGAAIVELPEGGFGILTDRDLRTRVLAAALPSSAPVGSVMTKPVFTVTPGRLGGEVLFELLERGIRHAPVVSEAGQLVGVVEDADLFAPRLRSWFGARRAIARAQAVDALARAAAGLPGIVLELHASSLRALEVGRVLSALVDAVTTRALELAAQAVSVPRDGIVWVAVGSHARRELTPGSTPLGALVCSEPPPSEWLEAARRGFAACGLASEIVWRDPSGWRATDRVDALALSVLTDRRALFGTPREALPLADGSAEAPVLVALRERALASTPPTGFDADAVLQTGGARSDRLDIRRTAVMPITAIAQWAGVIAGAHEGSTPERLRAAAGHGVLSDGDAGTLIDAFELAFELRLAHQMERLAAGEKADDLLAPAQLSPLTRSHLRDVFRAITAVQRGLRE